MTSDKALAARIRAAGAQVMCAGAFRRGRGGAWGRQPLQFGVEVVVGAGTSFATLATTAAEVAQAGWGTLWLSGWPDPVTLAGALSPFAVTAVRRGGRRSRAVGTWRSWPRQLHRTGRGVRWSERRLLVQGGASDEATASYLDEFVAVYRLVCAQEHPVFVGRHFGVAGARNEPRPLQPGGPPILLEAPPEAVLAGSRPDGRRGVPTSAAPASPGHASVLFRAPDGRHTRCHRLGPGRRGRRPGGHGWPALPSPSSTTSGLGEAGADGAPPG